MNAILGARIRSLREAKGLTQEQIAEKMNCSRQKYARMERGLTDISYASITKIAAILEVEPENITSAVAVNNINQKQSMFRKNEDGIEGDKFEFINEMIDVFYAHRRLYDSTRQVETNE